MKNIKFIIFLTFLIVLDSFVLVLSSLLLEFKNHADLDGFTCPTLATLFDEYNFNRIRCLTLCADTSSCFGVFHDQGNRRCVGCADMFLANKVAPTLNETHYYRRPVFKLVTEPKTWNDAKVNIDRGKLCKPAFNPFSAGDDYHSLCDQLGTRPDAELRVSRMANCQELGGHLAYIKSEEVQMLIESQVLGSDFTGTVWIGASRKYTNGTFYWEDDTPLSDYYSNWRPSDPDNYGGIENCVEIISSTWNDDVCSQPHHSLCELD